MPQGGRTKLEELEFNVMLFNANLLYLFCSVLILLDRSYSGRFWTGFEAFLSMRSTSANGLSNEQGASRMSIRRLRGMNMESEASLKREWSNCTVERAYEVLKGPDVEVTNKKDKDLQLPKLLELNRRVKRLFETLEKASPIAPLASPPAAHAPPRSPPQPQPQSSRTTWGVDGIQSTVVTRLMPEGGEAGATTLPLAERLLPRQLFEGKLPSALIQDPRFHGYNFFREETAAEGWTGECVRVRGYPNVVDHSKHSLLLNVYPVAAPPSLATTSGGG